jgi:hypothetical protein
MMIFIVGGLSFTGTFLTFPYKEEIHSIDTEHALITESRINSDQLEEEKPYGNSLKRALLSRQFIVLFIFAICSLCKILNYTIYF